MIRKAKMSDSLALVRLSGVLGYAVSRSTVEENLATTLNDPNHECLVFELKGNVIGYLEAEVYRPIFAEQVMFNVLGCAVDEASQGQGIGTQLLQTLESIAKTRKIAVIRLNSGEKRRNAHQFYTQQGYQCTHLQKRFLKKL